MNWKFRGCRETFLAQPKLLPRQSQRASPDAQFINRYQLVLALRQMPATACDARFVMFRRRTWSVENRFKIRNLFCYLKMVLYPRFYLE